jgi:hypothetical protein
MRRTRSILVLDGDSDGAVGISVDVLGAVRGRGGLSSHSALLQPCGVPGTPRRASMAA